MRLLVAVQVSHPSMLLLSSILRSLFKLSCSVCQDIRKEWNTLCGISLRVSWLDARVRQMPCKPGCIRSWSWTYHSSSSIAQHLSKFDWPPTRTAPRLHIPQSGLLGIKDLIDKKQLKSRQFELLHGSSRWGQFGFRASCAWTACPSWSRSFHREGPASSGSSFMYPGPSTVPAQLTLLLQRSMDPHALWAPPYLAPKDFSEIAQEVVPI